MEALQARVVAAWRVLENASARTQLYILGGFIFLLSIGVMLLPITRPMSQPMVVVGAMFMAVAVVIECYFVTLWALETAVGKLAGTLAVAAVVPIALGLSSNTVAQATGQSPADFPYAVGVIAPFTAGYFVVIVSVVIMFFGILGGTFVWMFCLLLGRKERVNRDSLKFFARFIGVLGLFSLVNAGWKQSASSYEGGLRWMASTAAYILDTHPSQECDFGEGMKLKRISDDLVIVSSQTKEGITFVRKSCPIGASVDSPRI
ncbi:hypothetical protein D3C81_527330 [compost metagenome]